MNKVIFTLSMIIGISLHADGGYDPGNYDMNYLSYELETMFESEHETCKTKADQVMNNINSYRSKSSQIEKFEIMHKQTRKYSNGKVICFVRMSSAKPELIAKVAIDLSNRLADVRFFD